MWNAFSLVLQIVMSCHARFNYYIVHYKASKLSVTYLFNVRVNRRANGDLFC